MRRNFETNQVKFYNIIDLNFNVKNQNNDIIIP